MKTGIRGVIVMMTVLLSVFGCVIRVPASGEETKAVYQQISQEEAREMMSEDDGHIIVDVRTQEEYDGGHIPEAVCIPNELIADEQPEGLPDLEQIILVYCRSGRRSKEASQKLADIGYTNIYEFGGIIDWTGEVVTEDKPAQDTSTPKHTSVPGMTVTPKPTATPEPALSAAEKKKMRKKDPYNPKYYDTPEEYADFIADNGAMFDEDDDYGDDGDLFYDDLWDDAYDEWKKVNK